MPVGQHEYIPCPVCGRSNTGGDVCRKCEAAEEAEERRKEREDEVCRDAAVAFGKKAKITVLAKTCTGCKRQCNEFVEVLDEPVCRTCYIDWCREVQMGG